MPGERAVRRGREAVREVLEGATDLRFVDAAEFRAWLAEQLPRWRRDPAFARRERLRQIRRAWPRLRELERECRRAAEADAASAEGAAIRAREVELRGVRQAVAGLSAALDGAEPGRRDALEAKRADFAVRHAALRDEVAARVAASPTRAALERVRAELARLRRESGWRREEARLRVLLRSGGRRSGGSGAGFEAAAHDAVAAHLLSGLGGAGLRVLRGVTLGAADTEIDLLVVRPGDPAEVLALVEAKRNPNDVAHGFARRQADLAWLAGERGAYDPAVRTTRAFPTGHFDRPATHDGVTLAPASFRRFRRDPVTGHYLDRLCFATRPGALAGLSGAALARLRHRAATDERFDPEDDAYLDDLLAWCRTLAAPIETPDVLRLYAGEARARQILWL